MASGFETRGFETLFKPRRCVPTRTPHPLTAIDYEAAERSREWQRVDLPLTPAESKADYNFEPIHLPEELLAAINPLRRLDLDDWKDNIDRIPTGRIGNWNMRRYWFAPHLRYVCLGHLERSLL